MSFYHYKYSLNSGIQTSRKNQHSSALFSNSTEITSQEPPAQQIPLSTRKGFRKFNHSQETGIENDIDIPRDPKDEFISKFSVDVKNFYGFNDDPRRDRQLSKHLKIQPKTAIHCKGSIDKKKEVDNYYLCNVNNTHSNLNKSCYKFKYSTTKEDYAKILNSQVEEKFKRIEVERLKDKMYMKQRVEKEREEILTEKEEKLKYLEKIREDFKENNKTLQSIRKAIENRHKEQEMIDHKIRLKNIEKGEIKRINNEEYRKYHNAEYFETHLLKQLGAKNIEKRRNKHNMRSSSM